MEGYHPIEMGEYVTISMKAAFMLDTTVGIKKLRELVESLSNQYADASVSLHKGLAEKFTYKPWVFP